MTTVPTVAIVRKKKTARPTAKKASGKTQFKSDHFPRKDELLIDAGYAYPEQCIDELLELAADTSPQARCDLLNALQLAQATYEDEKAISSRQRPRSTQIDQLEKSIEKTCVLLRHIRRYDDFRNIGFVMQPIGRGVVDVATTQEMILGRTLELPRHPSISDEELTWPTTADGMTAAINIEPLLRAPLLAARRRRRGRGNRKLGKEAVVFYAEQYFRRHSPKKPSTDAKNPFHEFVERFYEVVTKTEPVSLDRQMRRVFAARRSGR